MLQTGRIRRHPSRESGYILLTLLLFIALLVMAAAVALPKINHELERDREEEMVHRGAQYARAVRSYYRKFGRYPASIEQLEDTNHLRFLRQRYKDPVTGKDFQLLRYGQVRLSQPLLPGQPAGPGNNPGTPPASPPNPPDAGDEGGTGATGAGDTTGTQDTSTAKQGAPGTEQTFGGGGIIGVVSTSKNEAIREYGGKNHYDKWYFVFDPVTDRGGLITGPQQPLFKGAPPLQPGAPGRLPGTSGAPPPSGTDQNPPQ
jgi:type II secretory pathway pseudopilin PulG